MNTEGNKVNEGFSVPRSVFRIPYSPSLRCLLLILSAFQFFNFSAFVIAAPETLYRDPTNGGLLINPGVVKTRLHQLLLSDGAAVDTTLDSKASVTEPIAAAHAARTDNPHATTKAQVGLGNADNTSDANKPVSTAQQAALDLKVNANGTIVSATHTKITYDAKGLVTSGADATTADIADSTDKRYVTDAQRTVIQNTSGTNTGDQDLSGLVPKVTTVNGHALSANVTVSAADVGAPSGSGTSTGTNTGDQVISDATISTTDITTNNVSTTKHGFAPKLPNDSTKYLNGAGAYTVPPDTNSGGTVTTFSSGNLSPLFTASVANPTTTPALTFTLSNAATHTFFGNETGSTAAPHFVQPAESDITNLTSDLGTLTSGVAARQLALVPTAVKTSAYTAAASDLIPVDTTSGAVTVTLPTAPADRSLIAVKHVIQGSTNTVTITAGGSDVFNKASGGTSLTLTLLNQAVILQYKASGAIWYVLADDLSLASLDARFLAVTTVLPATATATSHNFFIAYNNTTGAFTKAQPAIADLSDAGQLGTWAVITPGTGIATWLASPTEANLKTAQSGLAWLDTAQTFTAINTFGSGLLKVTSPWVTTDIKDSGGNSMLAFTPTASAVDGVTFTNAATANPATVTMAATGSDSNINLALNTKGTGKLVYTSGVTSSGYNMIATLFAGGLSSGGYAGVEIGKQAATNDGVAWDFNWAGFGSNSNFFRLGMHGGTNLIGWGDGGVGIGAPATPGANNLGFVSAGIIKWNNDAGIGRNAAGIVEINSGTAGTFRDLKLRTLLPAAGTTTVAPIQFTAGTNLTTPIAGGMEYDGTNLFITDNAGTPARHTVTTIDGAQTITGKNIVATQLTGTVPAAQMPALTGDVTTSAGAVATTIAPNAVTNAKAAQMAANTIKGNNTGSTATAADLTVAQTRTLLGLGTADSPTFTAVTATGTVTGSNIKATVIGASGYHNAAQSIATSTSTTLVFNSEHWDTDTIHDTGTNNSRFVCKTAGKYSVQVSVEWAGNATGFRELWVRFTLAAGGNMIITDTGLVPSTGSGAMVQNTPARVYDFAVNDYIEVLTYQSSGGALNVNFATGNAYTPEITMVWLGP
jgi:hypothetical protein